MVFTFEQCCGAATFLGGSIAKGPGADLDSDPIGAAPASAPAPDKMGGSRQLRLRLQTLKFVLYLSSKKVNLLYSVLKHVYVYKLN